jgi:hypothetical protein
MLGLLFCGVTCWVCGLHVHCSMGMQALAWQATATGLDSIAHAVRMPCTALGNQTRCYGFVCSARAGPAWAATSSQLPEVGWVVLT